MFLFFFFFFYCTCEATYAVTFQDSFKGSLQYWHMLRRHHIIATGDGREKNNQVIYLLTGEKEEKKTLTWNIHSQHAKEQESHFNSKEKGKRLHLLRVRACVHILNLEENDKTRLHSFWHSHIQHLIPDIHIRPCHHRHNLKCASRHI